MSVYWIRDETRTNWQISLEFRWNWINLGKWIRLDEVLKFGSNSYSLLHHLWHQNSSKNQTKTWPWNWMGFDIISMKLGGQNRSRKELLPNSLCTFYGQETRHFATKKTRKISGGFHPSIFNTRGMSFFLISSSSCCTSMEPWKKAGHATHDPSHLGWFILWPFLGPFTFDNKIPINFILKAQLQRRDRRMTTRKKLTISHDGRMMWEGRKNMKIMANNFLIWTQSEAVRRT